MNFEKEIEVRWADVDQNGHVRHSAYYDYGAHVRVACISQAGYNAVRLSQEGIGPILFHEQCTFIREIKPGTTVRVNMRCGELRLDGSRWVLHHEFHDAEGLKLAHITVKGAWMNLAQRKLCVPPDSLREAFAGLDSGEAYVHVKK